MHTVVELPSYSKLAKKLLPEDSRTTLISYIANNPKSGTLIEGTGGIRKLRWATPGKGKSGGVRAIYYHYDEKVPIFLLTLFAKNEKDNLSDAERAELKKLTKTLIRSYRR